MRRTTVLFVDDDDFIRGAYGDLLRDEGFSVVEAADGFEALEAATSIAGEVVLVLDDEMPGIVLLDWFDGCLDAVRLRVFFFNDTATTEIYTLPRRRVRVQAVVPKPFTADELLSTLHKLAA